MKTKTANTAAMAATSNFFSRKIGNTTYVVSVTFSEKGNETMDDKILRLVTSQSISQETGGLPCN